MADDDADDLLLQVEKVVVDGNEFIEFQSGGQELDHSYCYRLRVRLSVRLKNPLRVLAGWAAVCVVLPYVDGGRLFQVHAAAAGNERSPTVCNVQTTKHTSQHCD